jgi:hypothetical protein
MKGGLAMEVMLRVHKDQLTRKLQRYTAILAGIKERQGENPSSNFSYHGGWDAGYYTALVNTLEDALDILNALEINCGNCKTLSEI